MLSLAITALEITLVVMFFAMCVAVIAGTVVLIKTIWETW
jgi:hypothetical protein